VTRFTTDVTGWDYYVGGHAYGNTNYGYVVYLGGHSYASCSELLDPPVVIPSEPRPMIFEFDKSVSNENITLLVEYTAAGVSGSTTVNFTKDNLTAIAGNPLKIDLNSAWVDDKKFRNVTFENTGESHITIDSLTFSWTGGHLEQQIKKIIDTVEDEELHNHKDPSGTRLIMSDFTINATIYPGAPATDNNDCTPDDIGAVRYVLNTLFQIAYDIRDREYVRASPVVKGDYLYQGSFEYPSYTGHFRRYDVTQQTRTVAWDTAEEAHIKNPMQSMTLTGARQIYTSEIINGFWFKTNFDGLNINKLKIPLQVTPLNADISDELAVIKRVRGWEWDYETSTWNVSPNRLGGIMYSAPAIVDSNSRTGNRTEMAYFGDVYGMVHAIETATGNEKWAYIPRNLLGKLKNDRANPGADEAFAAVDGSPVAKDIYFDHDGNPNTDKVWRTVLIFSEGWGNNYIFALDVTDPDNWRVMWERTVEPILSYTGGGGFSADEVLRVEGESAGGVVVEDDTIKDEIVLKNTTGRFEEDMVVFRDDDGDGTLDGNEVSATVTHVVEMGHAFRAALGRLKWPVRNTDGDIEGYEQKWAVFVATNFLLNPTEHGGINVFAFDLATGDKLWHFSDKYFSSHNDMPGAVTLFDTTGNGYVDRLFVGDIDGRLWELDAETGANPNGTDTVTVGGTDYTKPIPLYNAGIGYPIGVSPTVVRVNPVIVIFGTGGTFWADASYTNKIYAVNASEKRATPDYETGAGTLYWEMALTAGEKVWSSPTVAGDIVYVATATGTMDSDSPRDDLTGEGILRAIRLTGSAKGIQAWSNDDIGKVRGSLYVDRQHIYLTTVNNEVVQIGNGTFTEGGASNVKLRSWKLLD
jgi:hypothetical protein